MKFELTNNTKADKTFKKPRSYASIFVPSEGSVIVEGNKSDFEYYRKLKFRVRSIIEKVGVTKEVITKVPTEVPTEVITEVPTSIVDDHNLSPDAVYSFGFLTRDRAVKVLKKRKVKFGKYDSATKLKNLVIETNPMG